MPEIVFPLSSSPGFGNQESGGRLINAYTEKLGDFARAKTVRRRVPGLLLRATEATYSHCRGFFFSNDVLYTALDQRLVKATQSGSTISFADLGALVGTTPVTFAENKKDIPDKVVVTEEGAFVVTDSAAPSVLDAPNLSQPNSVTRVGGYLVFTSLFGEITATQLNSLEVRGDSITTAESKNDTLYRGVTFRNEYFAMGKSSIDVYINAGTSPFPLAYQTSVPRGLKGQWAVAGFQDGWSNELCWVGDDNVVYQLDGYRPVRISTHDVESAIEGVSDASTIIASVYMTRGNAILSLSSSTWTWERNMTTGLWHERKSYLATRWRASQTIQAFDKWLAGDLATGKLGEISGTTKTEFSDPLIWQVDSAPGSNFPGNVAIPKADFDFEAGVGAIEGDSDAEIDPKVGISWSDNGGATFSSPILRALGQQGKWNSQITVNRTGRAGPKGRIWRLTVADPVRVGLYGGAFTAEGRA